jgi:DamX protein
MQEQDWYLHYGLDRDPFAPGGVEGLFFPGGARQETVEQLQHLARFGDSALLVAGAHGAGKSATLAHFVAQCASDTRCSVVEVALLDGPEQVLRRVLDGFGVHAGAGSGLQHDLQRLESFCERCRSDGLLTWAVFDDAQHLHEDAITLLAPLLERMAGRLKLVFFAEPQWRPVLRAALPPAVHVHLIDLAAFDRDDCEAYIHYRMKTAGLEVEPPFTPAELEEIYQQSGGMPGRIDALAREVLVDALRVDAQPLARLPVWHFGVVALTLLALALLYAWSAFEQESVEPAAPSPSVAQGAAGAPESEPVIVTEEAARDAAARGAAAPGPAHGGDAAQVDADVAEEAPGPETPSPAKSPASGVAPAAPPASVAVTPPATPARAETPAGDLSADEGYLLALDPSFFVLQVMSANDRARIQQFASRQTVPLRQYRKMHGGRPWYALVQGEYRDRAAAERSARDVAARIPGAQPWVRRVDEVQREIREARQR